MNQATKILFRKSQLESLIEKAQGMIIMGTEELGMSWDDELIQSERQAMIDAEAELKEIKNSLAEDGVFMV